MIPYTTLRKLREANACNDRYNYLVSHLGDDYGDDTPITLPKICETNGIEDVLWIPVYIIKGDEIDMRYRLFAVACCQDILHLMEDKRSRDAVRVAHLYAHGEATQDELEIARDAARDAARDVARDVEWDTAWDTAWDADCDAASAAVRVAEWDAVSAAVRVADWVAVRNAEWDTEWDTEWDATREKQASHFIRIFSEEKVI